MNFKKCSQDYDTAINSHTVAFNANPQALSENKEKKKMFRSVRFQTWAWFFVLAALVLFVLWLFQALFFKMSYGKMKKLEVERLGDKIISKYPGVGDKEYDAYLEEIGRAHV